MGILGSVLLNQLGANPMSASDLFQNYANARVGNNTTNTQQINNPQNQYQFQQNQQTPYQAPGMPAQQQAQPVSQPDMSLTPSAPVQPIDLSTPSQALNQVVQQSTPSLPTAPVQPVSQPAVNTGPQTFSDIPAGTPVQTQMGMGTAPETSPNGAVIAPTAPTQQPEQPAPINQTPPASPAEPVHNDFVQNQNDPSKMAQLAYDKSAPPEIQKAAAEQHYRLLNDQKQQLEAEKTIKEKLESGNLSDFARMLNKESKDGSYIKAYLFHRLGLNELSKNEQQKLGAGIVG